MGSNCEMFSTNAIMNLYLKSTQRFSVFQVNYYPVGVSGVGIVATILLGWYSDFTQRSWHVGVLLSFTAIIAGSIMLDPPSFAGKMFALYLNGCQWANQTVMFAWANRLVKDDAVKRSFILAAMNTAAVIFYSFWAICFYAADQGPMWRKGSIAMIVSGSCMLCGVLVVKYLEDRDRKRMGDTMSVVGVDRSETSSNSDAVNEKAEKSGAVPAVTTV